jgi:hypothetical protein
VFAGVYEAPNNKGQALHTNSTNFEHHSHRSNMSRTLPPFILSTSVNPCAIYQQ